MFEGGSYIYNLSLC